MGCVVQLPALDLLSAVGPSGPDPTWELGPQSLQVVSKPGEAKGSAGSQFPNHNGDITVPLKPRYMFLWGGDLGRKRRALAGNKATDSV